MPSTGLTHKTTLVKRDAAVGTAGSSADAIRAEIAAQEKRLRVAFPRSYVDFLVAYWPTTRTLEDWEFLHVSAVDAIDVLSPGWTAIAAEHGVNADDEEYFTYGVDQSDTTRVRYLDTALVVGRHDMGTPFLMVLHPEVLTADGEMETEIFFHAGSLRAPSS